MIKILLVDDMRIVRECLKMIIEKNSDFEVVGSACNGLEAIEMCKKCKPDVILMDVIMPELNGIDAIMKIREENKKVKILVLSSIGDEDNIMKSIKNGADGYVLKDIGAEELILAIQCINKGLSFVHKNAYSINISNNSDKMNKINSEKQIKINSIFNELTNREKSVLELVAEGMSNEEIAVALNISEGRVRNVVSILISKFMLNSRTQLAVTAVKFYL
ncbi:response regulator transcription factor [Clostridium magnum]|uniref:Stage 0 sporulation protein A homolog n=1 Tax=Clostridium magnum DSM 2767 TaxID=1121326 RepID=A0A162T6H7_9CLOT|nr:response regulator transcription factor [Clostridium magnum]KZL92297.1 transcriptional regulatory protein DegU [Clostridium magnum DSM 2767]SHH14350.1 two component transcriptional regulator, LuxR family [Clostridium magnum DSM 2767]